MVTRDYADLPMKIKLPEPGVSGVSRIEELLAKRRSVRRYTEKGLPELIISRFLWAAQGISSKDGLRTSPSAGALYPLEIHAVVGEGNGLEPGIYRYIAEEHTLTREVSGDMRDKLAGAALSQPMVRKAAVSLVISAVYPRITGKYGKRGIRYADMEAGHAARTFICWVWNSG